MKKVLMIGGALAVWLVTCGLVVGTAEDQSALFEKPQFDTGHHDFDHGALSGERERIRRGFEINPVKLNLRGKDLQLVGLGSYVVNTGGCNDCHTNPPFLPGGDPFLGEKEMINAAAFLEAGSRSAPASCLRT